MAFTMIPICVLTFLELSLFAQPPGLCDPVPKRCAVMDDIYTIMVTMLC